LITEVNASVKGEAASFSVPMEDVEEPTIDALIARMDKFFVGALKFHTMEVELGAFRMTREEGIFGFASRIRDYIAFIHVIHPLRTGADWIEEKMLNVCFDGLPTKYQQAVRYAYMTPGCTFGKIVEEVTNIEHGERVQLSQRAVAKGDTSTPKAIPPWKGRTAPAVRTAAVPEAPDEADALLEDPFAEPPSTAEAEPEVDQEGDLRELFTKMVNWKAKTDAPTAAPSAYRAPRPAAGGDAAPKRSSTCLWCKGEGHYVLQCPTIAKLIGKVTSQKVEIVELKKQLEAGNAKAGPAQKGSQPPAVNASVAAARLALMEPAVATAQSALLESLES
jgi:hypothetical protein